MYQPGSSSYIRTIVLAQMLAQIGAFALPALLPTYMPCWHLSATDAGWLIGIFFAAYVVAVPLLLALTDRVPIKRIYLLGTGLTAISHLGFAVIADGFWDGLILRALAGIGWAGTYMTGLKALADHLIQQRNRERSPGTPRELAIQALDRSPSPEESRLSVARGQLSSSLLQPPHAPLRSRL